MQIEPTSMLYWYPLIAGLDIPQPKTQILPVSSKIVLKYLFAIVDESEQDYNELRPQWERYITKLESMAEGLGYPVFMRTDVFSGKHDWNRTCFVPCRADLGKHLFNLIEMTQLVDFMGLLTHAIVLREFLQLDSPFVAPHFGNMPVARERRYFIRGGKVLCHHHYWIEDAVRAASPVNPTWQQELALLNREPKAEVKLLTEYAEMVAKVLPEYWSVDFACDAGGTWWLIDMAEGEKSWHPECKEKGISEMQECQYVDDLQCALTGKKCELEPETGKCVPMLALEHRRGTLDATGLGLSASALWALHRISCNIPMRFVAGALPAKKALAKVPIVTVAFSRRSAAQCARREREKAERLNHA